MEKDVVRVGRVAVGLEEGEQSVLGLGVHAELEVESGQSFLPPPVLLIMQRLALQSQRQGQFVIHVHENQVVQHVARDLVLLRDLLDLQSRLLDEVGLVLIHAQTGRVQSKLSSLGGRYL